MYTIKMEKDNVYKHVYTSPCIYIAVLCIVICASVHQSPKYNSSQYADTDAGDDVNRM